jgi:hypothetical protein
MRKWLVVLLISLGACSKSAPTAPHEPDVTCPVWQTGPAIVEFTSPEVVTISFPGHPYLALWPTVDGHADPAGPCRRVENYDIHFGAPQTFSGAWVFFGVDRGGVVESHLTFMGGGRDLILSSIHKEDLADYNGFTFYEFEPPVTAQDFHVNIVGYVTDPANKTHIHWWMRLQR